MAEPRRVQLTTLSRSAPASFQTPAPVSDPPSGGAQESERCSLGPAGTGSVRLHLKLFESDEQNFSEFSYTQLIEDQINPPTSEDPSRILEKEKREKDEIAVIAKRMEAKYGGKPQKKKDRIQDLIDIGYGYDDEDSFIDNSEAYDEFVPSSITTEFGGFYVNSGVLQYRQAPDAEAKEPTTAEETPEMPKKRKLPGGQDKMRQCSEGEQDSNGDPRTSPPPDLEKKSKKKKNALRMLSVTSMLKRFQRAKDREQRRTTLGGAGPARTAPLLCPADAAGGGGGLELADPLLSLIGSTNNQALIQAASTVDFDIDLDSLLDEEATTSKAFAPPATEMLQIRTKAEDLSRPLGFTGALDENPEARLSQQFVQLPEGLSSGLEESIRKLMAVARTSEGESKLKFFSPDINSILLDIELQCREQGGPLRSRVYTLLSSFMPCSRDTLLKRVKKLVNTHVEAPLHEEDPLKKLKEAIGRTMPEQIIGFHESYQAYEQIRSRATDEDNVDEKAGKRGGPRKLFKWNEEIRDCLSHVLKDKMSKYEKEKKEGQEIEEFLKALLDTEVKPLWPKGWMQSRALVRESKKLLRLASSISMKKGKNETRQSISTPAMMKDLPPGADHGLDPPTSVSLGVAQKEGAAFNKAELRKELDGDSESPADADKPRVKATSASVPPRGLLPQEEVVIQQQQQQQQPPQEVFTAAVALFDSSDQHASSGVDAKKLPLGFSASLAARPQAKKTPAPVYIISDDDDDYVEVH